MSQFKEPYDIIICGVGGQGNILASSLVGLAATVAGYRVVVGETYGASQRGGSVMSHVRVSREREYGPLIPLGRVDLIVGFEPLETLRVARQYANCDTVIIVNTTPVYPVSVVFNEASYPEVDNILKALKNIADAVYSVDAVKLAREAGEPRAQNIVMINALSVCPGMPIKRGHFEKAMLEFLENNDREFRENNRRAFELPVSLQPLS